MIEVVNLYKNYSERQAVKNLNFKIEKGDVVGLLGPNGAGKSTTMKIVTGFMSPSSGVVKISGVDIFENPIDVKKKIGYLPEIPPLYSDMSVWEYLNYVAELKQVPKSDIKKNIEKALIKTQLLSVKSRLIRNLSKGFKQRVGIAQALVSDPEVLVLDEPTVGLDPKQVAEIRQLINELKGSHTIILSTHILSEVQATCNKVIIIHQGEIVAQNSIEQIEALNQSQSQLQIQLQVRNSENISEIKKIDGIISVHQESVNKYIITCKANEQITDLVAECVLKNKMGFVEMKIQKNNLEDVFLKLTYGQSQIYNASEVV